MRRTPRQRQKRRYKYFERRHENIFVSIKKRTGRDIVLRRRHCKTSLSLEAFVVDNGSPRIYAWGVCQAPRSHSGHRAAQLVNDQIAKSVKTDYPYWNRGAKEAWYYVLMYTDAPAILVETAFIDNDADAKILVEQEDTIARAIARGITDYFI